MVVVLNDSLINLRTLVEDKPLDFLVDSTASHSFLSVGWCKDNGLEYEKGDQFNIRLADGQEFPVVDKQRCLVDLRI